MWRWEAIAVIVLLLGKTMQAQEYDSFDAIADFIGNVSVEDADPDEVERLSRYIQRPLRINMLSLARIRESGLLTQYQTAALIDYRTRHGDILSLTELAAVDGFGNEFVERLSPFISLESTSPAGQGEAGYKKLYQKLELKGGVRYNETWKNQYALKYRIQTGESLQAGIAFSKSADASRPDAFAGNIFWYFRRYSAKLALGDFNARFGQGLALWSGMSISGLSKPSSYLKRSSNLSASHSYTGNYSYKGIAAEAYFSRLKVTVLTAFSGSLKDIGLLPAANLSWLYSNGQIGLTHYIELGHTLEGTAIPDMKTSCDLAFTFQGVDLFMETAYDWASRCTASLAGVVFPAGENLRMASMFRYYPSDYKATHSAASRALTECSNEYGASLSGEFEAGCRININGPSGFGSSVRRLEGSVCLDAAYFPVSKSDDATKSVQVKSLAEMMLRLSGSFALKIRLSERFRTWGAPLRSDFRMDALYYSRYFDAVLRTNVVNCAQTSFLTYAEGTCKAQALKLSLRFGIFRADKWDDRIYAYERDVPGSFNVPAFYGRGYWVSLTGTWRAVRWGTMHLRASLTEYPFMEKKKPGKAELKLMLEFRI